MTILVAISIALISGIVLGYYLSAPFIICVLICAAFLICATLKFKRNKLFKVFVLLAFFCLGVVLSLNAKRLSVKHIGAFDLPYYKKVLLKGIVIDEPRIYRRPPRNEFTFKTQSVKINRTIHDCAGIVLVKAFQRHEFSYGDEIIIRGGLLYPGRNFNRSVFDYGKHLKTLGIEKIFISKKKDYFKICRQGRGNSLKTLAYRMKNYLEDFIFTNIKEPQAQILSCMLLGSRELLDKKVKDNFARTGTVHILAISGLHVGIAAFIFSIFFKALNIRLGPRVLLVILLLAFYSIITGLRVSIVRSGIMVTLYLIGIILERESDIYNCLALSAIFILVFRPWQVFNLGFQLSYISVLSICYLAPRINIFLGNPVERFKKNKFAYLFSKALVFSLSAWMGTWILIAYYFNSIAPVTIFANLLVVPYMSLVIAAGFSFLALGQINFFLASTLAAAVEFIIGVLLKFVNFLAYFPGAYFEIPQFSWPWIFAYYALICVLLYIFSRLRIRKNQKFSRFFS